MPDSIDSAHGAATASPKITAMNLKGQLQLLLDCKGITAAELSRKSGVSKQVLSLWLSGAKPKNIEQVKAVADALCVTVDHLVFGHGVGPEKAAVESIEALMRDGWVSGLFEVKLRLIKKG